MLLVSCLELEISGVVLQEIRRNSEKAACSEDFLFSFSCSVLIATVQRLLGQI